MSESALSLPRETGAGASARRFVEHRFAGRGTALQLDDIKLVVSELVDNAVLHGQGGIRLSFHEAPEGVRIEVADEGEGAAIQIREQGPELGGWGLRLVDQLAERWGAYEGTTHVWALMRLDPQAPPAPEADPPGRADS